MTQLPVYTAPSNHRLSLIGELTKLPSRPAQVPAEDQLTAMAAWLADHSAPFARALCELFLGEDDREARDALAGATVFCAQTQVRLPSIGAGFLWADLSLAAQDRAFQLLVEVKLGSDFHEYTIPELGRTIAQPEAYLHAWRSCDDSHEARVRRLGTITLDGKAPSGDDPWRASDVTWADIHDLFGRLADNLAPDVRLVAQDLRNHLAGRVLPPVVAPEFLTWGSKLARGVCHELSSCVVDGRVSGTFAANEKFHMPAATSSSPARKRPGKSSGSS